VRERPLLGRSLRANDEPAPRERVVSEPSRPCEGQGDHAEQRDDDDELLVSHEERGVLVAISTKLLKKPT